MAPDDMGTTGSSGMPDMNEAAAKLKGATGADRMILVSGIVLLVSSFLDWYTVGAVGIPVKIGGNLWDVGGIGMLGLLLGIVTTAFAAARVVGWSNPIGNMKDGMLYLILGGATFVCILLRGLLSPGPSVPGIDVSRGLGLFIGVIASAAMAYGCWMKNQSQS